jgi:DNA-binding XRE family transcriptional regulator
MSNKTSLFKSPPYALEQHLVQLGQEMRRARVRRNLTIADVAEKIGADVRTVSDAEKGKISTGIGVYYALLWTYGLLDQMSFHDEEGERLASFREKKNAYTRASGEIDNDF